jgi:hypothetical protein
VSNHTVFAILVSRLEAKLQSHKRQGEVSGGGVQEEHSS